jgi:hypothetical protein
VEDKASMRLAQQQADSGIHGRMTHAVHRKAKAHTTWVCE